MVLVIWRVLSSVQFASVWEVFHASEGVYTTPLAGVAEGTTPVVVAGYDDAVAP